MGRWMGCLVNDLLDTAQPHDERADGLGQPPVGTGAGIRGSSPYFPLLRSSFSREFPYWQDRGRKVPANGGRSCPAMSAAGRANLLYWPDMSGQSNQWSKMGDTGLEPVTSALSNPLGA